MITALTMFKVEKGMVSKLALKLGAIDEVVEVLSITGEHDLIAKIQVKEYESLSDIVTERLQTFCDEMGTKFQECKNILGEIKVAHGQPVDEILNYSQECGCDMIVMGTHGYGLLADALMGSVSRRVVRRSMIPVMTVRLPE